MMKCKFPIICLMALLAAACTKDPAPNGYVTQTPPEAQVSDGESVIPGWIRIKLQEDALPLATGEFTRGEIASGYTALDEAVAAFGATQVRRSFNDGGKFAERRRRYGFHLWYDIKIDEEAPVSRAAADIASIPGIAHVQPIYRIELLDAEGAVPAERVYEPAMNSVVRTDQLPFDDPELGKQWHYNNRGTLPRSVAGADMNVFEAWKRTGGDPEVIVAVTDGGVDWNHPDLAANMWVNEAELNGTPGVDDDNNGYIDDIYGWNCMRQSGDIVPNSHGTHVAGTVGAVNNNGLGVAGVAGGTGKGDGVRIMSCQIIGTETTGSTAEAYLYAADNGAVISQNSWVYNDLGFMPEDVSNALDYFIENAGVDEDGNQTGPMKGGIIIFAAGNANQATVKMPAADPRTIAVTAMAPDYTRAGYSNYGTAADIYAPGGSASTDASYPESCRVYSTDMGGGYCYMSGTSMACPHVSGAAALILSYYGVGNPGFTPDDLKKILLRSYRTVTEYVDSNYADKLGVGLLDAGMMFVEDPQAAPASVSAPTVVSRMNQMRFSWTVPSDGNEMPVANFVVSYSGRGVGKFEGRDVSGKETFRNHYAVGNKVEYSLAMSYNTEYSFEVRAEDRFGNLSQAVSLAAATGDYENKKPVTLDRFGNIQIENTGKDYTLEFLLSAYFTDPNIPDGDILTYSVNNRNEDIVRAVTDGDKFILEPLAKGSAHVTVYAYDLDGEAVQLAMTVTVVNGEDPPPVVEPTERPAVYPNPADDYIDIFVPGSAGSSPQVKVYDAAHRLVMSVQGSFDAQGVARIGVSALSPGIYTVALDHEVAKWSSTFMKK